MAKNLSSILRGTNYGTLPISSGGTGATSAAAALAALGAQATLSAATGSANGYLTSADWVTFNSKQATLSAADGATNGYLTSADWSTFNGKQAALVSGTNIKTVNGTTLLGSGDLVITGGASATKTIANKTAAYTVVAGDLGTIINCTSGTFTVSLTAAATLGSGFVCTIWNTGTGAITIDPNVSETIDGVATLILQQGEGLAVVCNGTNWETDDKKPMRGYAENLVSTAVRPVASGDKAVAIMQQSTASGAGALAIGYGATASAQGAIAIGYGTPVASSTYSTAIGSTSLGFASQAATYAGSMALGGSYASGADSFAAAIANNTSSYGATGTHSIAIGASSKASGGYSTAIGEANIASGNDSFAVGYGSTASGVGAISIGYYGSIASGGASFAFGQYAASVEFAKYAYAAGKFATVGDAQYGKLVLRAATTTTTAVILTSNQAAATTNNQLIIASNQAMTFFGILIAKQSASNNMASYKVSGAISNNAGTMALADVTVEKIVDTIGLTTEPTFTADSTNKALAVTSGAKATTNIRWVMNIDSCEVVYA
jgi:hypothetical protein